MRFDQKTEQTFNQIFKTDEERLSEYYAKSCRSWILTYEIYGVEQFTSGASPEDCAKRTNEKHGEGNWIYGEVLQKDEFKKRRSVVEHLSED